MNYRLMRYPHGKTKAVTFSYDDGHRADLQLLDILQRHGLKGTFNIDLTNLGQPCGGRGLDAEEIRRHILDAGHEVAVHGQWHRGLGQLTPLDGIQEVLHCRQTLEQLFGRIIRGMAYADTGITRLGDQTDYPTIRSYLQGLGIAYARSLGGDNDTFALPADWYNWVPTAHHDNPHILAWAQAFTALDVNAQYDARRFPRLFYVWGHSFELQRNGNWDHMERLCALLGGRVDTWYATNMELYEYVQAYNALVISADGRRIYNPTLQDVYLEVNRVPHCIPAGKEAVL